MRKNNGIPRVVDLLDVDMIQEGAGQAEVVDESQLEDEGDVLSDLTPSSQDVLSCSALINIVNDLSAPQVVPPTSGPFYPLYDFPIFTIGNWATEMNCV